MRLSSERFPRLRWIVVPIKRPHPLVYERAHLPYSISAILERLMVRMDQSPILANNYFRDPLQGLFIPSEFKTQPGPAHPMDWYDQIYVTSHTSKLTILHELMRFLVHHSQPFSRSQRLLNDIYDRLKPKLESLNKEMLETHPSRDWLNTMIELTSNYVRYQFFKTSEAVAVVLLIHKWRTELGLSHSQAQYNLQFGIQQITEFAIFSAQDIERLNSPADHRLGHRFVSSAQFEILTKLHQHYHAYFKNQLDELTTGVCELALTAPTPSVKKK